MIFGVPLIVLAVIVVYMMAVVITTEYLKKKLFFVDPRNSRHSLVLSWVVGAFYFLLLLVTEVLALSVVTVFMFVLVNGVLNLFYRFTLLKQLLRKIIR